MQYCSMHGFLKYSITAGSQSGVSTCSSSDDEVLLSGNQYSNKSKHNMKKLGNGSQAL